MAWLIGQHEFDGAVCAFFIELQDAAEIIAVPSRAEEPTRFSEDLYRVAFAVPPAGSDH